MGQSTGFRELAIDDVEQFSFTPELSTGFREVPEDADAGEMAFDFLSGFNQVANSATFGGLGQLEKGYKALARQLGFDKAGFGLDRKPRSSGGRVAQQAGKDAAIGIAGAAVALATAGTTAVAPAAAKTSEQVTSMILQEFRKSPMLASLFETTSTAGGGAGRQFGEEIGAGPAASTALEIGGALAPTAAVAAAKKTPTALGIRFIKRIFGKDPGAHNRAVKEVGKALDTGIGDKSDLDRSLKNFQELGIEGRPSLAEATDSPQLKAKQIEIEASAKGAELDHLVARKLSLIEETKGAARSVGPAPDVNDASIVLDAANARISSQERVTETLGSRVAGRERSLQSRLPEANRQTIGRSLRNQRENLREGVRGRFNDRADEIGLNNTGSEIDATVLRDTIHNEFFTGNFARNFKGTVLKQINKLKPQRDGSIPLTFDDIDVMRKRLGDDASALAAQGKHGQARDLWKAQRLVDNWFESLDSPFGVDPKDWAKFRSDYKTQMIQRFDQGVAFKVGKTKSMTGEFQTRDEAIAKSFVDSESGVDDFIRLYGNDPSMALGIRSIILDEARQAAVKDGIVNERALLSYIDRKRHVLNKLPGIKAELDNVVSARRAVSGRQAQLKQRSQFINSQNLKKTIQSIGADPGEFMQRAIKDPKTMRQLSRAAKQAGVDDRAVASLVWEDAISTIGGDQVPSPKDLLAYMSNHRASLNIALGPKHIKSLERIYDALTVIERVPIPAGKATGAGALDKFEQVTGSGVPQISSRVFAVQSGRTGKFFPVIDGFARFANRVGRQRADALYKEALYDPNVANELAMLFRTSHAPPEITRKLNTFLFNMGSQATESQFEEQQ